MVVWSASIYGQGDVYAQIFGADGQPVGNPIAVFTGTWTPDGVGALPDGSFVVAASEEINTPASLQTELHVQKVSATGQLLASGGLGNPAVNGGLSDMVLSQNESDTIEFVGGQFFVNPDGSYSLSAIQVTHPVPNSLFYRLLVNVDAAGNVLGAPVNLSDGYTGAYPPPVLTRLRGGNFLEAGTSTITYGPVVWRIVTSTGQVLAQQSLGAAPGNGTSAPQVAALADGTGVLAWAYANSTTTGWQVMRVDATGQQVGSVGTAPNAVSLVTGLTSGGDLVTTTNGSQLLGQYFTTSQQPVGSQFVIATDLGSKQGVGSPLYAIVPTSGGFTAVYEGSTSTGQQLEEISFVAPALN